MAKAELGTKRTCPDTGKKFYDLNKDPIVSPYTNKSWPLSYFEETSVAAIMEKAEEEEVAEVDTENTDVELVSLEDADEAAGDDIPDMGDDDVEITATLPGGEDMTTPQALSALIRDKFDFVPTEIARRWSTTYGSRTWRMLEGVETLADMGEHLGGGLYTREVDYLCSEEWATTAHDILWRRSKLGLFTTPAEQEKLAAYLGKVEQNRKIEAA